MISTELLSGNTKMEILNETSIYPNRNNAYEIKYTRADGKSYIRSMIKSEYHFIEMIKSLTDNISDPKAFEIIEERIDEYTSDIRYDGDFWATYEG
jgi:hypothetical protein